MNRSCPLLLLFASLLLAVVAGPSAAQDGADGIVLYIGYPDAPPGAGRSDLSEVMMLDLATGETRRLTQDDYPDAHPTLGPGGTSVIFASHRPSSEYGAYAKERLFEVDIETGEVTRYDEALQARFPEAVAEEYGSPAFSRDGRRLAFSAEDEDGIRVVVVDFEAGEAQSIPAGAITDQLSWSPDGTHLLIGYLSASSESGGLPTKQYLVLDVDTRAGRRPTDFAHTNISGVWSPEGDKVLVLQNDRDGNGSVVEYGVVSGERDMGLDAEYLSAIVRIDGDEMVALRWEPSDSFWSGDFYSYDLETGEVVALTESNHQKTQPSYYPR